MCSTTTACIYAGRKANIVCTARLAPRFEVTTPKHLGVEAGQQIQREQATRETGNPRQESRRTATTNPDGFAEPTQALTSDAAAMTKNTAAVYGKYSLSDQYITTAKIHRGHRHRHGHHHHQHAIVNTRRRPANRTQK